MATAKTPRPALKTDHPDRAFAEHCCEMLSAAGLRQCVAKRMFGGHGVSSEGLTVALLADLGAGTQLWLKSNPELNAQYEAAGCQPFLYPSKNGPMRLHYWSAPDDALDNPDAMRPWAMLAWQAALTAQAEKAEKAAAKTVKAAKTTKKAKAPSAPAKKTAKAKK